MSGKGKGPSRARAVAAAKLQRQRAAERRRRALLGGAVAAAVLVVAVIISIVVFNAQKPSTIAVPPHASSDGVLVGSADAPVTVDIYVDYLCPFCKAFETEAAPALAKLVSDHKAKIAYHPVAFLDNSSTTKYSTRAANAAGCVTASAGQDAFVKYTAAMYAKQPPENSPGLADNDLKQIAADAGAPAAASCIAGHTYADWVADLTERASRAGVNQTPTVKVNGTEVARPTGESVTAAVDKAGR